MSATPATHRAAGTGWWATALSQWNTPPPPGFRTAPAPDYLDAARASLSFGAENGRAMRAGLGSGLSPSLTAMRAAFVTISTGGKLRGCHGSVIAQKPLLLDVVANAYKAAFEDRRFGPLTVEELAAADVGISVLSTPRPIRFADEADLTRQLRPDVDGLILQNGDRSALFLPSVWDRVPRPGRFLRQLKRKAGLAPDHWSESLRLFRYTAESFGAQIRSG